MHIFIYFDFECRKKEEEKKTNTVINSLRKTKRGEIKVKDYHRKIEKNKRKNSIECHVCVCVLFEYA